MDVEYRIRIQKFFVDLYESIDVKETSLLDRLYQQNVLSSDEVERIRKEVTKQDANKKLLLFLIRSGPAAFNVFLKCLRQAQTGVEDLIRLVTETPIDVENESVVPYRRLEMENWSTRKVVQWLRENGFSYDTQVLFYNNRIQGFDLFNDLHDLFRPGTVTSILINKIIERRNMYIRKRESVRDSFLSAISETDTEGDYPDYGQLGSSPNLSPNERFCISTDSAIGHSVPQISGSPTRGFNTYPRGRDTTNQSFGHDMDIYEMQRRTFEETYKQYQQDPPDDTTPMRKFVPLRMLDPASNVSVVSFSREAIEFEAQCLNSKHQGIIYFGFEDGRAVGVCMPRSDRLEAQLSKRFKRHVDQAFEHNGQAKLYIAQRAIHGPHLTNLGPPGTHFYLITLEIHPPKTIIADETFPVRLPNVNVMWDEDSRLFFPDPVQVDAHHLGPLVYEYREPQGSDNVFEIGYSKKRSPVLQESSSKHTSVIHKTETAPVKIPNRNPVQASTTTASSSLEEDITQHFIDHYESTSTAATGSATNNNNRTMVKLGAAQGAVPKTNLNKITSGSTLSLFGEAKEVVDNLIHTNVASAMQAYTDVKDEINSSNKTKTKSKLTVLMKSIKNLSFGKKNKGSITERDKTPTKERPLHRQTSGGTEYTNYHHANPDVVQPQYPDLHNSFYS